MYLLYKCCVYASTLLYLMYLLGMERYQNFYRYRYLKITQYRYSIGKYADTTTDTDTDTLLLFKKFADTDTDTEMDHTSTLYRYSIGKYADTCRYRYRYRYFTPSLLYRIHLLILATIYPSAPNRMLSAGL